MAKHFSTADKSLLCPSLLSSYSSFQHYCVQSVLCCNSIRELFSPPRSLRFPSVRVLPIFNSNVPLDRTRRPDGVTFLCVARGRKKSRRSLCCCCKHTHTFKHTYIHSVGCPSPRGSRCRGAAAATARYECRGRRDWPESHNPFARHRVIEKRRCVLYRRLRA